MWSFLRRQLLRKQPFRREFPGSPSGVEVFDRGDYRVMRFIDAQKLVQGKRHTRVPLDYGLNYLQQHLLATYVHPAPKTALILGLGVGALPTLCRVLYPGLKLTIIELNPAVIQAAETCFGFQQSHPNCQVICTDAHEWLAHYQDHTFDLIFNDCFDGLMSSVRMRSVSTLENLSQHLSARGIVITNLLAHQNIPQTDWIDSHALHQWVWPAHRKSNMSYILSHTALDWGQLEKRLKACDLHPSLPFSLSAEFNRLKVQI